MRILLLLLSVVSIASADVVTTFSSPGRQCAAGVAVNAFDNTAIAIQDNAGVLNFILLNANDSVRVSRRVSGSGFMTIYSLALAKDNGFIVIGGIQTSSAGIDGLIMKFSANGNLLWKKNIGTPENDEFRAATLLNDGSIIVVGHRTSSVTSNDLFVAKFSASGGILWKKVIGTSSFEHAGGIATLPDNSVVISPGTEVGVNTRALWININAAGTILWSRTASTPDSTGLLYMPHTEGGFLLGYLAPLRQGALAKTQIARFNSANARLWSKSFGVAANSLNITSGFVQSDGSVFLAGGAFNLGPSINTGIITKISSNGVAQWKRKFTASQLSTGFSTAVLDGSESSLLAAGCVGFGSDFQDASLVKLPLSGSTTCPTVPPVSLSTRNVPFDWSNFAIQTLSATFRVEVPVISTTNFVTTKNSSCGS